MDDIEEIQQLNVNINLIIETLQVHNHGEASAALWSAFIWEEHPYKFDFWYEEGCKQRQGIALSRKAVEELERILAIKILT